MTQKQATAYDLILRGGMIVNHDGQAQADIAVRDGQIADIGDMSRQDAEEVIDITGLHALPGVIDTQVHFREPGNDHKEDLETGSRAAVLGGVTGVFEMPNTYPPTTTPDALIDKVTRATNRMFCDFAFYAGATRENATSLGDMERLAGCCGVKIFMGSSTGTILIPDDESLRLVLENTRRNIAVHSEDEPRLVERQSLALEGQVATHAVWRDVETATLATTRLLKLTRETGRRVHVLHVTTAQEVELLAKNKDIASVEVTPQHLTLAAPDCYDRLGTLAQMNPPIREDSHRQALWHALGQGVVDVIGSDHAPHTLDEKAQTYPSSPSGMPGVQTLVPIMLNHAHHGRLSLERLVDLTSFTASRLFNLSNRGQIKTGYQADITVVDIKATRTIENQHIASRCGWTPFDGMEVTGWPRGTIIRGRRIMWDDDITGPATGQPLQFNDIH